MKHSLSRIVTWLEASGLKRVSSILVLCSALSFPIPALGQTAVSNYVAQLEHQGYTEIEMERTLLGRTKITAKRNGVVREIVVARNGQVLFDYKDASDRAPSFPPTKQDDRNDDQGQIDDPDPVIKPETTPEVETDVERDPVAPADPTAPTTVLVPLN